VGLLELKRVEPTLEDVFMKLVTEEKSSSEEDAEEGS
jgi:hypothetical protein